MIAMPGRVAMLTGRTYQACPYTPVHHKSAGWREKANAVREKRIKLGSSCGFIDICCAA